MKKCRKCGAEKSIELFYRDAQNPDGRSHQCKTCVDARRRAWKRENAAHVKEWQESYYRMNRERIIARQIEYNKRKRAESK